MKIPVKNSDVCVRSTKDWFVILRLQGARNKSNTHFASVYPGDNTNNTLPLLENEDIWWWENAIGNARTDPNLAKEVVLIYMGALEEKFPRYEM